ncbi:diacylglycerol/lipid kinase family protein [Saccharopolyspora spinosporotrichia]
MVNVHARNGGKAYAYAVDRLRSLGVPVGSTLPLRDPSRLPETVAAAVDAGHDLVVIGGGDGSVSSVVDVLAHRDVPLGLLPLGTANDFARTMHIPGDLEQACRTIADGHIVDVDLGLCGDNYYVNRASIGIGARVVESMSPWLKRRIGALAYPVATVKAFVRHRPFRARLRFPDDDHPPVEYERLLQVSVANGRYFGGGQLAAPDSGIDDSTLDVSVIRQGGVLDLLAVARNLRTGGGVPTWSTSAPRASSWRPLRTCRSTWTANWSPTPRSGSASRATRCTSSYPGRGSTRRDRTRPEGVRAARGHAQAKLTRSSQKSSSSVSPITSTLPARGDCRL